MVAAATTEEVVALIIGAGPSGLAAAASLACRSIPYVLLERDDCIGPLWRKRIYDRVTLHLAKRFCELPSMPYPPTAPTFVPGRQFAEYLDAYAAHFGISPRLSRHVQAAEFDKETETWRVEARNLETRDTEEYNARFLVVATGENDQVVVPEIPGMESFGGEVIHSSQYRSGEKYKGKSVLVVGSGNSGMEIAFDLSEAGAQTSIVVRSQLHLVTREIWYLAMMLTKLLPYGMVDALVLFLCYLKYGNISKYGIHRPSKGPLYLKMNTSTYPVVDVGTFKKIKSGEIQVLPSLSSIQHKNVTFVNGKTYKFDAIILATGYKSAIKKWLKSDDYPIGDDGLAKQKFLNHWKGGRGIYCAGLVRRGIYGAGEDAESIANDISSHLKYE